MKIIPAIDLMDGEVVRLLRGDPGRRTVYGSDPLAVALRWQEEGADMLHIVDLDATLGSGSNMKHIKRIAAEVEIPVQIAGGLRDVPSILDAANTASRVVVGTIAFRDRPALAEVLEELGPARLVISVDHRAGDVAVDGWREAAGVNVIEAVRDLVDSGFSEFLVTEISRDGTMRGPELEHLSQICTIPGVNAIASGGVSGMDDVHRIRKIDPSGVILGKALYEGRLTVREAKLA